jgi:hypothetical protein
MGAKKRLNDSVDVKLAVAPNTGPVGGLTGIALDLTGYSRARFTFSFGANSGTTAALSSGIGVYQASSSGATFTAIASAALAAVSSGVLGSNVMVIDVPVSPSYPWQKISGGSILSTAISNSCTVEPYSGYANPPSSSAQQVVVV